MEKTANEILLEAADKLENDNVWEQGGFFIKQADGTCKMCAHGALMYCGNNCIKYEIDSVNSTESSINNMINQALSISSLGKARAKAFKVGLSYSFNDHFNRTKQEVIHKLRKAALLDDDAIS